MPSYIRIPLAIGLLLMAVRAVLPQSHALLPLGGSETIEIGVLLLIGIGVAELTRRKKH